jgi:hypothetical protein
MLERQAEEHMLHEKQQELDSLLLFHTTVNSVGQLVEKSLADLSANLARSEKELLKVVKEGKEAQCTTVFKEVKQGIDIVASGVGSMRNLSTMVTRKLDDIHIAPDQHSD